MALVNLPSSPPADPPPGAGNPRSQTPFGGLLPHRPHFLRDDDVHGPGRDQQPGEPAVRRLRTHDRNSADRRPGLPPGACRLESQAGYSRVCRRRAERHDSVRLFQFQAILAEPVDRPGGAGRGGGVRATATSVRAARRSGQVGQRADQRRSQAARAAQADEFSNQHELPVRVRQASPDGPVG